ncbi:pyridoxamine 5'-phosphate oxidase [Biformimicrobium ophioploci]|uniref:Pyridoxine/pyridoxamine 5'-phosphate oxidase n=1 Tax=Biformimicrobium ophioploci TaxID=3036711 RepID=A0ABQ6M2F0_9GAMM|nr:pyridoxamine 5'-phosphate oxidase [Microbulbifer sp. NKW57]GMG88524.1 pyridoxamine 5'-phosphate oxidase [Microbulbifer sp. NKW57]
MDLENWRREYLKSGLNRDDMLDSPFEQFRVWMQEAVRSELSDPSAMCIATVDASGRPTQRIVLLKAFDPSGFVFYTNLGSRKAQDIAANEQVSLHFPWHSLERQVAINGRAEKLSATEALKYFATRPRGSQLAAWASRQSSPISTRQLLMQQFEKMKEKFSDGEIPLPDFWGGYRVVPDRFEFWQGGAQRLHDRFEYTREGEQWDIHRLSP